MESTPKAPPPPPSSLTTKESKQTLQSSQTSPKYVALPWLTNLLKSKHMANCFLAGDSQFKEFVVNAWETSKKDCIKDRLLVVDNLPLIDAEKRDELDSVLKRTFNEITQIGSVFMPLDETTKQTKGYAIVEVTSPQKVDLLLKKMHRYKLKAPSLVQQVEDTTSLKASLRASASLPRGTIKLSRYTELEKTEDGRVFEFLQSKLISPPSSFTPKCRSALIEIFNRFGGEQDMALIATQLNQLQLASNGKPLTKEQLDFAFKNYPTKQVGNEPALTLDGYLELYLKQCCEAPLDTWEELNKLGYDFNLNLNSYASVDQAIISQQAWYLKLDVELVSYVEALYTDCEVSSPLHLTLDHIRPSDNSSPFSLLLKMPLPSIRLRFQLLKTFNTMLCSALSLVNFDRRHSGSVFSLFSACRDIIFHTTKMDFIYEIVDKTTVQGNQPTVTIDRLKLAAKKDKEESESTLLNHTMFGLAVAQLKNANPMYFRQKKPGGTEPHFSIKIVFKGENVQGEGGPYRQFFTDVSKELQGILSLFIPCPNAQQGEGENRDKWIINPAANTSSHLAMFEFLGRLMGMALRTGVLLTMDLPSIFWKPLVGTQPTIEDLKFIDRSVYRIIKFFSKCTKEELEQSFPDQSFTTYLSDKSVVPIVEGKSCIIRLFTHYGRRGKYTRHLREQIGICQVGGKSKTKRKSSSASGHTSWSSGRGTNQVVVAVNVAGYGVENMWQAIHRCQSTETSFHVQWCLSRCSTHCLLLGHTARVKPARQKRISALCLGSRKATCKR